MNGEGESWDRSLEAVDNARESLHNGDIQETKNYLKIATEYVEILERQEMLKRKKKIERRRNITYDSE